MHALLVHGGAGRIRDDRAGDYRAGLAAALDAGWAVLEAGGAALDAAVAAVTSMEDDPRAFNAGTGSALTSLGTVECDAAVMTGDGRAGAVACVRTSRNPVTLARRVLEDTPHVLLVGPGAEALEPAPIDPSALITERSRAAWRRWRERRAAPEGSATCGAVALDGDGRLAAATSTGGVLGQWPGRVGDAPIPGAGTWADRRVAVSCTGRGEAFLRVAAAHRLASALGAGATPEAALRDLLGAVNAAGGEGGVIALLADGTLAVAFDTEAMAWGYRRAADGPPEEAYEVGRAGEVRVVRATPPADDAA
jgi:beta-aspartyl-peptidase (threonine type)